MMIYRLIKCTIKAVLKITQRAQYTSMLIIIEDIVAVIIKQV